MCTGNQCRTPMAEGLLRHRLQAAGIDAEVSSAGLMAGGQPATGHSVSVLATRGIDIAEHVSRGLADAAVADADLVIGMERRHVQEAVVLEPSVRERAFTLRDLVRRAEAAPPRRADEGLREWAARLAAGRTVSDLVGVGDDEVEDPVGRPFGDYERTAAVLDDLLSRLVACAWPGRSEARSA